MIESAPKSVFYLEEGDAAFTEIDVARKSLTFRLYRTKEEATLSKDVLEMFFGVKAVIAKERLSDIMTSARSSEQAVRLVLCEYDVHGELVEAETLLDPYERLL